VRAGSGVTGAEATRLVRQARALESHPSTQAALAAGVIHTEQATVIVAAVEALPAEVAYRAPAAEAHLLALADHHDARALRALGRHLLEVVAPEQADALIARQLEREETEARTTCYTTPWSTKATTTQDAHRPRRTPIHAEHSACAPGSRWASSSRS
jgi:hypothetical protein